MTGAGATDTPYAPYRKEIDGPSGEVVHVTEITDAACPWAWGSEPAFRLLRHTLGPHLSWRRVFGILFDEDDDPAPDPDAEARWYERFIDGVTAHTGAPRARRLHWLTRTSWPASLAAKAAQGQGRAVAEHVLRRLRESTFVSGTPADSRDGVRDAVRGVPGLDVDRPLRDMGEGRGCARRCVTTGRGRGDRTRRCSASKPPGPIPGGPRSWRTDGVTPCRPRCSTAPADRSGCRAGDPCSPISKRRPWLRADLSRRPPRCPRRRRWNAGEA